MDVQLWNLAIFAVGTLFGTVLAAVTQRRLDDRRIETALDTIGIRRDEFKRLSKELETTASAVATANNRLSYIEKAYPSRP